MYVRRNKMQMTDIFHLSDGAIIKAGDIVFNDFDDPDFIIGPNHARIGTEYREWIDMPIYRRIQSDTPKYSQIRRKSNQKRSVSLQKVHPVSDQT
jgi:hypothetical protein